MGELPRNYVRPGKKEPPKKNEMDRTPAVDSNVMSEIDGTLAYIGTRFDDYEDEEYDDITQIRLLSDVVNSPFVKKYP